MSEMRPEFDLLIKNVSVVRPQKEGLLQADIAVKDGRIVKVAPGIDAVDALLAGFPAATVSGAPKVRAMQVIA